MYLARYPAKQRITVAQVSRYAWITMRNSSGSSCSDSAVEPTRSQNITVSCRRSASGTAHSLLRAASNPDCVGWLFCDRGGAAAAGSLRATPHSPQNLAVGRTCWPQLGQAHTSLVPLSSQNFSPSQFSNPHLWHCMPLPYCPFEE